MLERDDGSGVGSRRAKQGERRSGEGPLATKGPSGRTFLASLSNGTGFFGQTWMGGYTGFFLRFQSHGLGSQTGPKKAPLDPDPEDVQVRGAPRGSPAFRVLRWSRAWSDPNQHGTANKILAKAPA